MKRLTARSILRRLRASATTLCVSGVLFPAIGLADGPAPAGRVRVGDRPAVNARPAPVQTADMRLYYIATPWSKVLENVANECGLTLVMHDTPSGNFTRNDWQKHTRDDVIRILNRDLEPLGYRLLVNEKFLTVIGAERARAEYPRRELETPPTPQAEGAQTAEYEGHASSRPAVTRVGHEAPAAAPNPSNTPAAKAGVFRFSPQNRPAIEISRDVFAAFESRATVQEQGPNGLPAFTVWRDDAQAANALANPTPMGGEWFTFELDTNANQIVTTADARIQPVLTELLKRLDVITRTEGDTLKLVAGGKELPAIGKQLRPQIGRLKTTGPAAAPRRVAWQPDGQPAPAGQPAPGGDIQTPALGNTPSESALSATLLGAMRGDVTIQSVDDLNLLILRGNEGDVEQVLQVIQLIERLAQGTRPEIRLHTLEHVSSEALSTLLTDVYQRVNTQQTERGLAASPINVVPVVQPNAILIVAPEGAMNAIVELASELDKPADPAAEVHVYRLKHAIASEVVTLLTNFYQDRPGLGTRVRVIADARTNSLIIQARPRELAEVQLLIKQVDKSDSGATHQARTLALQHASATELATFLTTAIQSTLNPPTATTGGGFGGGGGGGQNSQSLRDTKSVVLEFLQTSGDVKRLVKSGLLTDIRISGDPRTNMLLLVAPKESMPMLEELVRALDQPSNAVASVKMLPLKNADASAAVSLLTSLFEPQQQNDLGVQLAGAETTSSLIPLRFEADVRSNTVVAFGGEEALTMVEAILYRLDAGDLRNRQTEVLKLRNAPAADVASAINTFLQSQRDLLQLNPDAVSTYELLEQEVIVTPEPVNNYLLISATPRYFDRVLSVARQLDASPPQVMIQALLVEVELNDTDEFGVELGFQDPVLFTRSLIDNLVTTTTSTNIPGVGTTQTTNIISQSGTPGFLFNNNPLGNNIAMSPGIVGSQGLSNFGVGRTNTDLGFGGLVLSASSDAVSVLIRALASRRNVRILSRPQVLALDNQPASIQVGQQVPIVNGVNLTANGVANPQIVQDQAGIILTVQPRISPEGDIVMVVAAEKSAFNGAGVPIFTDTAGNVFNSPIKDITTASTTVKVPDGQTIVVGGMITKNDTTIERKVPWLGDVPVLKNLFRYDSHTERRTELLIFLTPRVIHGDGDSELIKTIEADRIHFFEQEAEAIHGPLFAVPPENFGMPIDGTEMPMPIQGGNLSQPNAVFQAPPMAPASSGPTPTPAPTPANPGPMSGSQPGRATPFARLGSR